MGRGHIYRYLKTHPNLGVCSCRAKAGWCRCRALVDCITNTCGGRREPDRTNKWKAQGKKPYPWEGTAPRLSSVPGVPHPGVCKQAERGVEPCQLTQRPMLVQQPGEKDLTVATPLRA